MTYLKSIGEVIGFLLLSIFAILDGVIRSFIPKRYKMKNIDGEIALVTGGGGGLGRLLSLRLANLGAIVVVWDINEAGIDETVKLVQAAGGTCYGYVCDLCDREDIYKKAKIIKEEIGKVTILINNAGIVTGMKFLDTPDKLIIRTMDVNVMSHFWKKAQNRDVVETPRKEVSLILNLSLAKFCNNSRFRNDTSLLRYAVATNILNYPSCDESVNWVRVDREQPFLSGHPGESAERGIPFRSSHLPSVRCKNRSDRSSDRRCRSVLVVCCSLTVCCDTHEIAALLLNANNSLIQRSRTFVPFKYLVKYNYADFFLIHILRPLLLINFALRNEILLL